MAFELLMSFIDTNIDNPTISDHSAITFSLQSKDYAERGPGFWKINNALLKDANFIDELVSKIPKYKSNILLPFADAQIILGGDMNFPLTPTDKIGGAADEIRRFKLHDIWRDQHTNKTQFTWRNNSLKVQCRLDYWLV